MDINPKPMPTNEVESVNMLSMDEMKQWVHRLKRENRGLTQENKELKEKKDLYFKEGLKNFKQNQTMRTALEKYADEDNWLIGELTDECIIWNPDGDGYEIAQTVLDNLKGKR